MHEHQGYYYTDPGRIKRIPKNRKEFIVKSFFLEIPTKIYFGRNTVTEAIRKEKGVLGANVMIITTSRSLVQGGYVANLANHIEELSATVTIFNQVSPEPQLSEIRNAVRIGKDKKITSVIGFGGGSSIDAAKATALGIGSEEPIDGYYYNGIVPEEKVIPVIAIPTTAGTGSELSGSAVISDTATNMKKGVRGWYMYPDVAIVDPSYTDQMPYKITKDSGFDALAHAMETYVSVKSTRLSEMLSEDAIKMIAKALPHLRENPADTEARDAMSYASMMMGINIGNVGTLLPHRLQYPIGMKTHTSHGEGLLSLFAAWVREEYHASSEKIEKACSLLSGQDCVSEQDCVDAVNSFIDRIGGKRCLKDYGLSAVDIEAFSNSITGVLENDPAYSGIEVINRIYQNSME